MLRRALAAAKVMNVQLKAGIGGNYALFFSVPGENQPLFTQTFHAAASAAHDTGLTNLCLLHSPVKHNKTAPLMSLGLQGVSRNGICADIEIISSPGQVIDEAARQQRPAL